MAFKVKKPCGHRVLVKLLQCNLKEDGAELKETDKGLEEWSESGFYLGSKDKNEIKRRQVSVEEAKVLMLGETAYKAFDEGNPWCQEGDIVSIRKYSGQDYEYEGEIYRVILDDDVICVLEEVSDE